MICNSVFISNSKTKRALLLNHSEHVHSPHYVYDAVFVGGYGALIKIWTLSLYVFLSKECWWHFCRGLSSIEGSYTRVSFECMPTFLGEIGQGKQR